MLDLLRKGERKIYLPVCLHLPALNTVSQLISCQIFIFNPGIALR